MFRVEESVRPYHDYIKSHDKKSFSEMKIFLVKNDSVQRRRLYWRRQRRETANRKFSSLQREFCYSSLHSSVCAAMCGVNVCRRQVVLLAMDQLYLPGWCPPQTPPIVCRLLHYRCHHVMLRHCAVPACPLAGCNWVWGN